MTILKTVKKSKNLELVKTEPIYGGEYALINWNNDLKNAKTGLTLDAANNLFHTLKNMKTTNKKITLEIMRTTNFKPLKMRMSNRFDEPAVKLGDIYYFPQDESKLVKREDTLKATIQAVYNDGKLRQDTFYIDTELYLKILQYWVKNK